MDRSIADTLLPAECVGQDYTTDPESGVETDPAERFGKLLAEAGDHLIRRAELILRDRALAHDAVQSALTLLWQNRDELPVVAEHLRAVATRATINQALMVIRARRRHHAALARAASASTESRPSPVARLASAEAAGLAWDEALALPDDERRVVLARFGDGLTIREAADELGLPDGTVSTLQRRALQRLRTQLRSRGVAVPVYGGVALIASWLADGLPDAVAAATASGASAITTTDRLIRFLEVVLMTTTRARGAAVLTLLLALVLVAVIWLLFDARQSPTLSPGNREVVTTGSPANHPARSNDDAQPTSPPVAPAADNSPSGTEGVDNAPPVNDAGDDPPPPTHAHVFGRVLDIHGDPVVGMPVMLSPEGYITSDLGGVECISVNRSNPDTITDADGRYDLLVDPGRTHYLMLARHNRFINAVVLQRYVGNAGVEVDLGDVVARLSADLEGVVTDPDGQSISGAKVVVQRHAVEGPEFPGIAWGTSDTEWLEPFLGQSPELVTDGAGRFSSVLPAGEYGITIRANGWMSVRQTVRLREGMRDALQFELAPAFSIAVAVTDDDGAAIADALVHVEQRTVRAPRGALQRDPESRLPLYPGSVPYYGSGSPFALLSGARTSPAGEATMSAISESQVHVVVRYRGRVTRVIPVAPEGRSEVRLTVTMQPSTRIIGRIHLNEKPIGWLNNENYARDPMLCSVAIHMVDRGDLRPVDGAWIEFIDEDFVIDGLPRGDYQLDVRIGSSLATVRMHAGSQPEQRIDPIELTE